MAFNKMTANVENISQLSDTPNQGTNPLTAEQLKAEFDKAPKALKTFINGLIDAMAEGSAAGNIGATKTGGSVNVAITLQDAVDDLYDVEGRVTEIEEDGAPIPDDAIETDMIQDDAVTGDKIEAGAVSTIYTVNVGTTGWDAEDITKTVTVTGLGVNDRIVVDLDASAISSLADYEAAAEAWSHVYRIVSADGSITLYADSVPETAFSIKILAVKK